MTAAADRPNTFGHLPVLDGLRTLAIVPVVLFHTWAGTFPGGFIGVDLFFVISGFLITSILMRERSGSGRVDLVAFWGRRVRRLVPAVVVLVAACAVIAHLLHEGSALGFVDSLGALTWSQNWVHLAASTTRWGLADNRSVVDHLWSLAIEEQFYLVWPLALLVICRVVRPRAGRMVAVATLIGASALVMGSIDHGAAYFRTDARAFELLGGALLALSGWRPQRATASVLAAIGIAATVAFSFAGATTDGWLYPWGFLASTAVVGGLVAAASSPPAWLAAAFGRPVQAVGRVSYGIYLWHIPVIRFLTPDRTHLAAVPLAAVRLVALAAVVVASHRLIEMPVRTRAWSPTPLRIAMVGALAAVALVPLGSDARDEWRRQYDMVGAPPSVPAGTTKVLVVGDGVATTIARAFPAGQTWDVSQWQCGLLPGAVRSAGSVIRLDDACGHWRERWTDAVDRFRPDVVVVAEMTWDLFDRPDGSWPSDRRVRDAVRAATAVLRRHGARVIWMRPTQTTQLAPRPIPAAELARRVARADRVAAVLEGLGSEHVEVGRIVDPNRPLEALDDTRVLVGVAPLADALTHPGP